MKIRFSGEDCVVTLDKIKLKDPKLWSHLNTDEVAELIEKDDESSHNSNIWLDITSKSQKKPNNLNSAEQSQNDKFIEVDQS